MPGRHATTGFLDARTVGGDGVVEIAAMRSAPGERVPRFDDEVPRTAAEIAIVLRERPDRF